MLAKIDIANFGPFQNFTWQSCVDSGSDSDLTFKDLNIIYGRNYSGKTTLSRLVRSLGTHTLSDKYASPDFIIWDSNGNKYGPRNLSEYPHEVCVFNRDYIKTHLGFLIDEEKEITPFAVLGKENTEITAKIKRLQVELDGSGRDAGLNADQHELLAKHQKAGHEHESAERSLNKLLTDKARSIKQDRMLDVVTYDARQLKADLATVSKKDINPLSADDDQKLRDILKEEPLEEFRAKLPRTIEADELFDKCEELLGQEVTANRQLQRLAADAALNDWVRRGMPLHRQKEKCGFCNQTLPNELWDELDAHFSKEVAELEDNLDQVIARVDSDLELFGEWKQVDEKQFLPKYRSAVLKHIEKIRAWINGYNKDLENIKKALQKRRAATLSPVAMPHLYSTSETFSQIAAAFQKTIDENNSEIGTQDKQRADIASSLRLSIVSKFRSDAAIDELKAKINELAEAKKTAKREVDELNKRIADIRSELQSLNAQLTNEAAAAERVNGYLRHHFGCQSISLVCYAGDTNEPEYQFGLYRGDELAYNLSEGECSLIAFCYFMARLDAAGTNGKDMIIFIDDPISSLDDNHIFFMFSLIEGVIAKPMDEAIKNTATKCCYKQLFISTHNLEFLRYLRRLSVKKKANRQAFSIEQTAESSQIVVMPKHLEKYATEFIYLFDQICECCSEHDLNERIHYFNNFGNNLRRFLEIYLFFKYPSTNSNPNDDGVKQRVAEFFCTNEADSVFVDRISNEFSHTIGRIDRAMRPTDVPEMAKLARFVLTQIRRSDAKQYKYLLESCEQSDPIAAH